MLASHLKDFVVINRVRRCVSGTLGVHGKGAMCGKHEASSTGKLLGERTRLRVLRLTPTPIANFSTALGRTSKIKIVLAARQNQHARRVRSQTLDATISTRARERS